LSVKDVQALLALQTSALQPLAEKAAAYSRHLYDIASGVGAEVTKMAEAQAAEAQKQFAAAVDAAVKNAPQGSEAAVAAVKTAMANANTAMESVQKAVKQAKDMAESNMKAISTVPSTKKTAKA
ncbi:TIGR01841 family phasin, partial [Arthrospira platensis SPKY1]|nr:TIGR01841 family phasin [Arthrospira platensis SPKY1]